jgi:glycosyltransferase involved in cell wall biosynthesis
VEAVTKQMVGSFLDRVDVAFISLLPEKLFRFGVSPNKVFEYMHAGKPILWAIEAGNNLIEEAQCGVSVPLGDAPRLVDAIEELHALTSEQRTALGQNGYNFVTTHHGYALLAEKLMKIIEG